MATAKEKLAEFIEGQANWRSMKAEEHPEDDRNQRWADNSSVMAEWVRELPADDPRSAQVEALAGGADLDVLVMGEGAPGALARCESATPEYFDRLLTDVVRMLEANPVRAIADRGES
jgi:hypothetical protein